ncbi:MAG: hypothetical protein JW738_04760 [Actinobacteria bacterium]|nr:hypothetical protein [Actinomycetota bacterium]
MEGELFFRPCRDCGTPRIAGRILEWKSDGTIISHIGKENRIVLLDSRIYNTVFDKAETELGLSIWQAAQDTTRSVTKSVIEELPLKVPGLRYFGRSATRRLVINYLKVYSRIAGHSAPDLVDYKQGKHTVARIKNPIDIDIVVGTMLGSFEAINRVPYISEVEKENDNQFLVRVTPDSHQGCFSEVLKVTFPPIHPGNIFYKRCSHCGVPTKLSDRLKWDHREGTIVETLTGKRFCVVSCTIKTVLGGLAAKYGDATYDLLIAAQRDLTMEHVRLRGDMLGPETSHDDIMNICHSYMDDWSLFGYGNPVLFNIEGDRMEAVVENPFDIHLLAGTLLGLYDALLERKRAINWYVPKEGVVSFAIEPV